MLKVEFGVPVVHYVLILGHEVWDQLEVLRGTGSGIVTGDCHLGFRQQFDLDVEAFRVEGVVVVGVVWFGRLLQITLDDVPLI